jgi:hypothetical protein
MEELNTIALGSPTHVDAQQPLSAVFGKYVPCHRRCNHHLDACKRAGWPNQHDVVTLKFCNETLGIVSAMHAFAREQPDHDDRPACTLYRLRKRWWLFQQSNPCVVKALALPHTIGQPLGGHA